MVVYSEWHRTAMDPKSSCSLPMTDEDTGLGSLASPLVGYLGKVQERAASLECCPWCTSKGLNYALRSYRINLKESITLCTNPQCLFPLVSRSLEDVLANLVPVEPSVGSKRKNALAQEDEEEPIKPMQKRRRSSHQDSQSLTDTHVSQAQHVALNILSNGQHAEPKTDSGKSNGCHWDSPVAEAGWESQQENELDKKPEDVTCTDGIVSTCKTAVGHLPSLLDSLLITDEDKREAEENRRCSLDSNPPLFTDTDIHSTQINTLKVQKSETAENNTCKNITSVESETVAESDELVAVPNQLFWRNSNNLCWLDSLLVALVNCKSLRKCTAKDEPQRSSVRQLLQRYEDISADIQVHHQTGRDGVVRVPHHVLKGANEELQSLRTSIFKLLQPKLHVKLGHRESPVFAMPLLLTMDTWAEPLFQSTFLWEFECSECKVAMKERVMKTLPTFTNILPDWHPLHAVHAAPCNVCGKKDQRRTMLLESLPPVFALHFVEGLPDNDVRVYTFTFKDKRYSVSTVIQYKQTLKHFVTWIHKSNGSWLEYDDLKHPDWESHLTLPVPAHEMHIVFWEAEDDKEHHVCSPSSTFTETPLSKPKMNSSLCDKDLIADQLLARTPDQSIFTLHNDTDIMCALSAPEDSTITAGLDASIGSTTLLDTFQGLSHNDIITLTLVELKPDSETQPLNDIQQNQDLVVSSRIENLDSTPDSSSTVTCNKNSHGSEAEFPTLSSSSASEDSSSSDPTFLPRGRGGRRRGRGVGRGQTVGRQNTRKSASSKAAPLTSAFPEPPKVISHKPVDVPAQVNPSPVEATQEAPQVVSSSDTSPLCSSKDSPAMPPTLDQNARLSFLLSKNPLHKGVKPISKVPPTPVVQVKKRIPLSQSTPNPVRKQQISTAVYPKPPLKTEKTDGLPLKAAEMYGAFGAKTSNTQSVLPTPALISAKSIPFNPPNLLTNATKVSGTSLAVLGEKEIYSSKKHSSSSKVPPGVSTTEALRYKLIKKLKAKKKKLAKLNEMLGHQGRTSLRPDSTDLGSPGTVTSSTYDSSICDDPLSDLLSPATTASNLSPDSTGLLEMLANGKDGVYQLGGARVATSQINTCVNEPISENFMDDFLLQAESQRPTDEETEALEALFLSELWG
ncbi:SUMO-specific isopeptidase USPL1 [Labrus bergylta]|uniref:SUMO-specific isopeptidase USPL1 n=1 Tax=Labrus bergylta TaxID=56723 RepID=UPI003313AFB4